jgi:hypothetical protein
MEWRSPALESAVAAALCRRTPKLPLFQPRNKDQWSD